MRPAGVTTHPITHYVMPFVIPAAWLALLGFSVLLDYTAWGREGHPSNSLVLFLYALLAAPLFGLLGGAYAWFSRRHYPKRIAIAAIVANVCLVGAGVGFWAVF